MCVRLLSSYSNGLSTIVRLNWQPCLLPRHLPLREFARLKLENLIEIIRKMAPKRPNSPKWGAEPVRGRRYRCSRSRARKAPATVCDLPLVDRGEGQDPGQRALQLADVLRHLVGDEREHLFGDEAALGASFDLRMARRVS